jgi:hypothetical protein
VFARQDFVGIDYGILECASHAPLPDYYGGLLWSQLMGRGVLDVTRNVTHGGAGAKAGAGTGRSVRAYAHCAPAAAAAAAAGEGPAAGSTNSVRAAATAVTVLLLNLEPDAAASVNLGLLGGGNDTNSSTQRMEWHLTGPNGTNAAAVALNGLVLQYSVDPVSGEAVLPALGGRAVARVAGQDDVVQLAPASIAFIQVRDGAAAELCRQAAKLLVGPM